jgi:hypothetical protein
MRSPKNFILRSFAILLIIGTSSCINFFIKERPADLRSTPKAPNVKYEISSISIATEDIPASFLFNLKRYLFAELSKRKLLGRKEDNPHQIRILIGYYRVAKDADANHVVSVVDVADPKSEEILDESEINTSVQKARNIEDVAKLHAKDIVKFLAGERKKQ